VDRSVVESAQAGDRPAFDRIVREELARVYRLSLAIVGNEADAADATQEAFVDAWRSIRGLRDAARFDAWLTRVAVNAARMTLRSRRRRTVREIPAASIGGVLPEPAPEASDVGRLRAALDRLPVEQRALLALRHLDGRGIPEIAAILEVPEGTTKSRLFTARRALEAALVKEACDE
jgi:RNA polymerase sigma-70 factor, ECF subfamily